LRSRGTESEDAIQRRLKRAIDEMQFGETNGVFDLTIINDRIDDAYNDLRQFIVEVFMSHEFISHSLIV
jgi:guanylate kinase